jgi:ABC-type antimicrobial peptide transport system permease subunit
MRVLGAKESELRLQQLFEFGLLSFLGGLVGSLVSVSFAWVASYYLFEEIFALSLMPLVISIVGTTLLGIFVSSAGTHSAWKRKPVELLNELA